MTLNWKSNYWIKDAKYQDFNVGDKVIILRLGAKNLYGDEMRHTLAEIGIVEKKGNSRGYGDIIKVTFPQFSHESWWYYPADLEKV